MATSNKENITANSAVASSGSGLRRFGIVLSLLGSAADANMLFWLIAISELMSMRTIMIVPRRVFLDMSFLPCLVAYGR